MKKIVITGGLGYIGSELCKIYSGESRFKDITVIDNRFASDRVKQLREWGINYIHGSISDQDLMQRELGDADVVIHLAGITDVAYVKSEENDDLDRRIRTIGVDGTRNVIKYTSKDCKILFPSTHVVYEGLRETHLDISEDYPTKTVLSYARGKEASERDLHSSGKNYVILRLASVCGISTDTMRINIMPNLFSKITSQNGAIKLFSGGVQLKSLVPLMDVARCFKFMEDRDDISREVFHCSSEFMTVKEVAEICKEANPNLTLEETEDEIPNLGYTVSNKKLLSTGFEFLYTVKECIQEMIKNWSPHKLRSELEFVDKGGKALVDSRGRINNYELTEPINLIGYIESKARTLRANHYHPIQEQKCLLIKGQYISVFKDLSHPNAPVETQVINAGDLSVIKPNVAHTMVFTEDSIFLNLVRGEREHENYGVTHTIPYNLVDEEMRERLLETYRTTCRSCDSLNLKRVISLGESPLANNLINMEDEVSELYPLEMNYCSECHNCQLSTTVPASKMFNNYLYLSSTSKSFCQHFEDAAEKYIEKYNLDESSIVLDVGSNDGIALKPFLHRGITAVGVEPATNICAIANDNGVPTFNSYFTDEVAHEIKSAYGKIDLITASNVFAHADDLQGITRRAFDLLKRDGTFIIEVQYLIDTLKDLTFDNIYHEHVNYWSVTSLVNFFQKLGFSVVDIEHVDTHGGSIRAYIRQKGERQNSVHKFLKEEGDFGIQEYETYKNFSTRVKKTRENVKNNFLALREKYDIIAGYGSPAKATTSLNYFGIDSEFIDYIIEDNPLKHDKYIPGIQIPIRNKQYCYDHLPDLVVVLAWNFFDYIKENNKDLIDRGVRFVSIKDLQT
jgi:nucleoside-diphosphate-sugar epimerase/SAM-dependent methyltransferase